LYSVEKLDSWDEEWKLVAPMNMPRAYFAAAQWNGFIYAFGGNDSIITPTGIRTPETAEKYNPDCNQWSWISNLTVRRRAHSAAVLDGKIYIVGGHVRVHQIECFDPNNDSYDTRPDFGVALKKFALVAV